MLHCIATESRRGVIDQSISSAAIWNSSSLSFIIIIEITVFLTFGFVYDRFHGVKTKKGTRSVWVKEWRLDNLIW